MEKSEFDIWIKSFAAIAAIAYMVVIVSMMASGYWSSSPFISKLSMAFMLFGILLYTLYQFLTIRLPLAVLLVAFAAFVFVECLATYQSLFAVGSSLTIVHLVRLLVNILGIVMYLLLLLLTWNQIGVKYYDGLLVLVPILFVSKIRLIVVSLALFVKVLVVSPGSVGDWIGLESFMTVGNLGAMMIYVSLFCLILKSRRTKASLPFRGGSLL